MRIVSTLAIVAVLGLSACANSNYGPKETGGTLLGAAGGAVAGAQFGRGNGQLAAVAVGTLLGAFVGNQVGQSLDRADQMYASQARQQALAAAPVGQAIAWSNPQSGHSGQYAITREGYAGGGTYCREYQQTIVVGGQSERAFGTACRQPDGSWRLN